MRLLQKSQRLIQPKLDQKRLIKLEEILQEFIRSYIFDDLPPIYEAENAKDSALIKALKSGDLTFHQGVFSGKLNATLTKALINMGAEFKDGYFRIHKDLLPEDIVKAIEVSGVKFEKKLDKIEGILNKKLKGLDSPNIDLFDNIRDLLFAYDSSLTEKLEAIGIKEELDEDKLNKISENYEQNMRRYIKDATEEEIIDLREYVKDLYLSGGREKELSEIVKDRLGICERRAAFIARQEMNLMSAEYKKEKMVSAGSWGYEWRSGPRARPMHKALDRQIFTWDNPPVTNPEGTHNHPGEDYNCFPGLTRVLLDNSVKRVFKRRYSGELSNIVVSNGVVISPTRNHPVLTQRGWVPAHLVQVGDYVFTRKGQASDIVEIDSEYGVSSFENVFNALSLCSKVRSDSLSESDFHNDVTDKKVDTIDIDHVLMLDGITKIFKEVLDLYLEGSNSIHSRLGSLDKLLPTNLFSSHCLVSILGEFFSFFERCADMPVMLSFRRVSGFNAGLFEPSTYNISRDVILSSNGEYAHPFFKIVDSIMINRHDIMGNSSFPAGLNADSFEKAVKDTGGDIEQLRDFVHTKFIDSVELLDVVDVFGSEFDGHVYNLENVNNWYFSNNIISHNCNCVAISLF